MFVGCRLEPTGILESVAQGEGLLMEGTESGQRPSTKQDAGQAPPPPPPLAHTGWGKGRVPTTRHGNVGGLEGGVTLMK